MNYKELPIFKGITPDAEAYLDKFDVYLKQNNQNLDLEEVFIRKVSLYYDYLEEKNKKNNKDFSTKTEKRLQYLASENGTVPLFFMMRGIYGVRRDVENTSNMSATEYYSMIKSWEKKNSTLETSYGDGIVASGWVYKTHPQHTKDKKAGAPVHRFILNVDPNEQLLNQLDEFAAKYSCQYKCSEYQSTAYKRPDTIVIYTTDNRLKEQKEDLKKIVLPHIRKNGNEMLDGEMIIPGINLASEASRKDIEDLANKTRTVYPRLADSLSCELQKNPKKSHPLSLGELKIYKDLYESINILKNPDSPEKTAPQIQHTAKTVFKEGLRGPFSLSAENNSRNSLLPELKTTVRAYYQTDPDNPDILQINGKNNQNKPTFTLKYNKKTGTYTYQGGKPEKTYSNDPNLNLAPLPDDSLSVIKSNQRVAISEAQIKANMQNGIEFKENDKFISVKREAMGSHEDCYRVEVQSSDRKPLSKFVIDKNSKEYVAFNFKTKEKCSNDAKLKLSPLAIETLTKFENRIKTARGIAERSQQIEKQR